MHQILNAVGGITELCSS